MTSKTPEKDTIASVPVPACYLCGSGGAGLYEGMPDRLFGSPGKWNLKRCHNPGCGLVWLDPMPSKEDIGKAYRNYFTHQDSPSGTPRGMDRPSLLLVKVFKPLLKLFLHSTGLRRREKEWRKRAEYAYLDDTVSGGRLLDVGCGKGDLLDRMRRRGWAVEGTDVDATALEYARAKHGLTVRLGTLDDLRFPAGSFDAITMNHVIEHVYEPVSLLWECRRILKSGGRLVVVTPNLDSLGHRRFGENWFPLDPPRHLHLFTKSTLAECARRAEFQSFELWSAPAYAKGVFEGSIEIEENMSGKTRRDFPKWAEVSFLKVREYSLVKANGEGGEEVVLMARKEG